MAKFTHNDIRIGDTVKVKGRTDKFTVTDVLDGFRGIGLTKTGDIHSKDRTFFDIKEIASIGRKLA